MHMKTRSINLTKLIGTLAGGVIGLILGSAVHADDQKQPATKPTSPATPATASPEGEAPLSGPSVKVQQKAPTIVERDAEGRCRKLEIQPAEAAVRVMKLSPQTREKVDAVLVEQAAVLDTIVRDNFELIVSVAGAAQGGDKTQAAKYLGQLWEVSQPLRKRGALVEQLAKVLSKEEATQLRKMVLEYNGARTKDEENAAKQRGEKFDNAKFNINERLSIIGQEIKRSYERVIGQQSKDLDAIIASLNLSVEQDAKVRQILLDVVQRSGAKATNAQKVSAYLKIVAVLDKDQRTILYEKLREMRGQKSASPAGDKPQKDGSKADNPDMGEPNADPMKDEQPAKNDQPKQPA